MLNVFTIRNVQLSAFQEAAFRRFKKQLVQQIEQQYPGTPGVPELVESGTKRAAAYDLDSQSDVASFVCFMIEYGEQFDTDPALPWISKVLQDPGTPAESKMSLLIEHRKAFQRREESKHAAVLQEE